MSKKPQNISALAREAGIPVNTVYARLRAGWTMKDALGTPVGERLGRPVVKKKVVAKKKRAAAKRKASVTHTTTKTTKVEYSSEPDKKLPKVTNPMANDSAVPGFTDPMDEHLTLASTSQRTLNGDGPIVDPSVDTSWMWGLLIVAAVGLGLYGLLHGLGGT
jgi:hypothetical protein